MGARITELVRLNSGKTRNDEKHEKGLSLKHCTAPLRTGQNQVPHLRKFPYNVIKTPHLNEVIGISYLHNIK